MPGSTRRLNAPCHPASWMCTLLLALVACGPHTTDPSANHDTTDGRDGSDGGRDTGPDAGTVELGQSCPLTGRIGEIAIMTTGDAAHLGGQVYDRVDPWIGPPELQNETCAFHRFSVHACGACPDGEVCSIDGSCVTERRVRTDLVVDITVDGSTHHFEAEPVAGTIYGDAGPAQGPFAVDIRLGAETVSIPPIAPATGLVGLSVETEGDYDAPGALDARWTPTGSATHARSVIPINHHAAGPTFTVCEAPEAAGAFHADAEMIDPLAVSTGLEFQGVEHVSLAAVWVAAGCVDVRVGTFMTNGVSSR